MNKFLIKNLLAVLAVTGVAACTTSSDKLIPDRRPDYRTSQVGNPLEIPPDLTSSTVDDTLLVPELNPTANASLASYTGERNQRNLGANQVNGTSEAVLLQDSDLRIARDGERRWLVVRRPADRLWPDVKAFWTNGGFVLDRADAGTGIMETEWLENRADIPDGPIRSLLKQYLDFAYAAATRDRFRTRLEPVGATTEVYLTHYGVEEVPRGDGTDTTRWQSRPRDPELEAEMLNRLMVHLGASERRAESQLASTGTAAQTTTGPRTQFVDTAEGYRALVVAEGYNNAWRLVGLALDDNNFIIEEQNRAQGLYLVERVKTNDEQRGWFGRMLFGDDEANQRTGEQYRIRLAGRGEQTLVVMQDDEGKPDNSEPAQQILESIQTVIQ